MIIASFSVYGIHHHFYAERSTMIICNFQSMLNNKPCTTVIFLSVIQISFHSTPVSCLWNISVPVSTEVSLLANRQMVKLHYHFEHKHQKRLKFCESCYGISCILVRFLDTSYRQEDNKKHE